MIPSAAPFARPHLLTMKLLSTIALTFGISFASAIAAEPLYRTDFEAIDVGAEPEGFMIIDGQFAVREFEGGKVFELPGSPLETFGFLFGPNFTLNEDGTKFKAGAKPEQVAEWDGAVVTARAHGAKQGRRFPTFSVGLCGVSGYKLRVAPMKRAIEIVRGDDVVATKEYDWASGAWARLKLQVRVADGRWIAEGKVWKDGDAEPAEWQITHESDQKPNPGKASAWAAPFSGQPVRFDDVLVEAVKQ